MAVVTLPPELGMARRLPSPVSITIDGRNRRMSTTESGSAASSEASADVRHHEQRPGVVVGAGWRLELADDRWEHREVGQGIVGLATHHGTELGERIVASGAPRR